MAETCRRTTITPTSIAMATVLVAFILPLGESAYSQQSDGVFVGHGRIARPRSESVRAPAEPPVEVESLEQSCFNEVNRLRAARGLEALGLSEDLLTVARAYSRRMAEEGFFSHTDPDGYSVRERVSEAGIKWRMLGENLAYTNGYVSPVAAAMRGWMESSGHRRNILSPDYRHAAVGAWIRKDTVYFTEIFLR